MSMPRNRNASWEIVLYPGTTSSSIVDGRFVTVWFVELSSSCKLCSREKSMVEAGVVVEYFVPPTGRIYKSTAMVESTALGANLFL